MSESKKPKRLIVIVTILVVIVSTVAVWSKVYRPLAQPSWITSDRRSDFLYGSVGVERSAGMPYWIWLVLPRIFPEYMPGPGGYASLGFSWEETRETPAGFSKKTIGYVRVAANCAMCHTFSRPNGVDEVPTVFAAGIGHTAELQKLLVFFQKCAEDPRFNADNILDEISMATRLSLVDRLLYRYVLIPGTRRRLLNRELIVVDSSLWNHSRAAKSVPSLRRRLETLEAALHGEEKMVLWEYLRSLPVR